MKCDDKLPVWGSIPSFSSIVLLVIGSLTVLLSSCGSGSSNTRKALPPDSLFSQSPYVTNTLTAVPLLGVGKFVHGDLEDVELQISDGFRIVIQVLHQ